MICEFGTRCAHPESNEVAPEKQFGYTPQGILDYEIRRSSYAPKRKRAISFKKTRR